MIEVPISNNGEVKLEKPQEKDPWDSNSRNTFDGLTYKDEELNETEGYYTEEEDETSSAIYLMNIDELPTEVQDESTVIEQLEKFIQTDTLEEKEKDKALEFFRKEKPLFAKDIQELDEMNIIT
ncbi:19722_t:CDS:2 [Cetraspora pellucida]|uniref:19722_t:CDS:1 n=1 Tax=Cetraspora pellucida TaxID=1433469 RepID=A0A9N9IV47_9GLOM|nr:19722_t:CDS:2 [Cetraspora pellucida]